MTRVRTGIVELDKMLHGGFMDTDSVMLAGSAGTGKTTLALQYLVNGATQFGENGLYLTFEQLPDQIYRDAKNFGWDLRKLEDENRFRLVCTSPDLVIESREGERLLDEPIRQINPRRIVIDSLSHLSMYVDEGHLRKEAYRLLMYFKTKGISSVSLWETPQLIGQAVAVTDIGLSFVVDSILLLRMVEIESAMRKAMIILKMRGSDHDRTLREYESTSDGIRISAPFTDYEGLLSGSPTRRPSDKFAQYFVQAAAEKRK